MAWSDLNADDLVSFNNMQTSGISLKGGQSASSSNDIMTKDAANTKYILDQSVSTFAAKNNLDCVAKKDLVGATVYTYNVRLSNNTALICGELPVDVYSTGTPFAPGIVLYTDSGVSTLLTGYSWIVGADSMIRDLNSSTGVLGPNSAGMC